MTKTISLYDGSTLVVTKNGDEYIYEQKKDSCGSEIWLTKWLFKERPLSKTELLDWLSQPFELFEYTSPYSYPGRCTTVL
jgi:hypothetical protein